MHLIYSNIQLKIQSTGFSFVSFLLQVLCLREIFFPSPPWPQSFMLVEGKTLIHGSENWVVLLLKYWCVAGMVCNYSRLSAQSLHCSI